MLLRWGFVYPSLYSSLVLYHATTLGKDTGMDIVTPALPLDEVDVWFAAGRCQFRARSCYESDLWDIWLHMFFHRRPKYVCSRLGIHGDSSDDYDSKRTAGVAKGSPAEFWYWKTKIWGYDKLLEDTAKIQRRISDTNHRDIQSKFWQTEEIPNLPSQVAKQTTDLSHMKW